MTQPPKTIWLQWDNPQVFVDDESSVTWCEDKIHDEDIEYHLVDPEEVCEWNTTELLIDCNTQCGKSFKIWVNGKMLKFTYCPWCGKLVKITGYYVREEKEDE